METLPLNVPKSEASRYRRAIVADMPGAMWCKRCGSMVLDYIKHNKWHEVKFRD